MSSIAIFPCTFTPVALIVQDVAASLDLKIYTDDDLFTETATKFGLDSDKIKQVMYGKTSVFNQFTLEKEKVINQLKSVLGVKLIQPENYLFYGYLTALISHDIQHVLKVLIAGNRQSRITYAIESGFTEKEAKKKIKTDDTQAYGLTDFLFKKEAYDSSLYDLVVPVELKSKPDLVEIIGQYYHKTSVLRTSRSYEAVEDMILETSVEQSLLQRGHKLTVQARNGDITLKVQKSVLNFDKLVREVTEIANMTEGVRSVAVEKSIEYNESIYRQQKFDLPSKVLFVDDEKEFVQTVSSRLISRDVGTYGVYNGEEALEVIAEDRPDVMVLDLKMPGLHGIDVLRRTKDLAPGIEVIILTGHGSNQDMLDCMKLGAFAYMNKPVDIEELSATIKAAHKNVMETKASQAK